MELTVERGRGYVTAAQNKQPGQEIGRIPVDSIYSPVLKVTYRVEATRVEQRTDFDRLIIDVETKASISPRTALASAGSTLVELFGLARELDETPRASTSARRRRTRSSPPTLALPIEELDLTVRSYNCLKREGINTVGELIARTRGRPARHPQLRSEVDRRGQDEAGRDGPGAEGLPARRSTRRTSWTRSATTTTTRGDRLPRDRAALTSCLSTGRTLRHAHAHQGSPPRRQPGARAADAGEPGHVAVRARQDHDHRDQGQAAAPARRAADHLGQAGRPARASPGADRGPGQGRRVRAVRPRSRRGSPTGRVATPGSSRPARARATPRRWRSSSWSRS